MTRPGLGETAEAAELRELAGEVAAEFDDGYWHDVNHTDREPTEFWDALADRNLLGITVPEAYGGRGLGLTELCAVVEELVAEGCYGAEMLYVVTVVFGGVTLTENGSDAQKEAMLEPLVDGELNFCMALTEPEAGHNAPNLDVTAERTGDGYRVNGRKRWCSGAARADRMLLVARTTPKEEVQRRTEGITLFVTDPAADGIEITEIDTGIPTPERSYELAFHDHHVPADAVVGTEEFGLYHLFETVNPERLVTAAGAVGVGLNALDRAMAYAREREVFGAPIGSHQAVQHPIVDSYSRLQGARLLAREAAAMVDAGESWKEASGWSNMAKLRATEAGHEATDVAVQTMGGNGVTVENTVIDLWKGSRLGRIAPGSNEMMRNHVAEHHLDLPRSY